MVCIRCSSQHVLDAVCPSPCRQSVLEWCAFLFELGCKLFRKSCNPSNTAIRLCQSNGPPSELHRLPLELGPAPDWRLPRRTRRKCRIIHQPADVRMCTHRARRRSLRRTLQTFDKRVAIHFNGTVRLELQHLPGYWPLHLLRAPGLHLPQRVLISRSQCCSGQTLSGSGHFPLLCANGNVRSKNWPTRLT